MPDFSKIYEKDDVLFDLIKEIIVDRALKCFKENGLPQTGQVMASFVSKTNFLKTAIFDLCEADNLYAANVIFRSLIEHVLKAQYVFLKWTEDKSDSVGENYLKWYSASESYDYLKSWEAVSKIAKKDIQIGYSEKLLFETQPELSSKTIKEIKNIAAQFQYRNIVKYINERLSNNNKPIEESFLLKIIPNYSELSGYVHGGPTADKYVTTVFIDPAVRDKTMYEIAELSVSMVGSISSYMALMLLNLDDSYNELYIKIRNAL